MPSGQKVIYATDLLESLLAGRLWAIGVSVLSVAVAVRGRHLARLPDPQFFSTVFDRVRRLHTTVHIPVLLKGSTSRRIPLSSGRCRSGPAYN